MRHSALQCLQRAKDLIAKDDEVSAKYACLELRYCIEYITYSQLQVYLQEIPDDTVKKWTPKQIISVLLEVDPDADQSVTISIGRQEACGIPAKTMKLLGEDRRFSLKWANIQHNALGSFLHAPSLDQIEKGEFPTKEKIQNKASEVVLQIDHILSSPVYNVSFGNFYNFDCNYCKTKIKCRVENINKEHGIICPNSKCKAVHDIDSERDNNFTVKARETKYKCPSCNASNSIGSHLIDYGNVLLCISCKEKAQIQYMLSPIPSA
jgi:hypothetical protein